jgi:hypothetical protein
MRKWKKTFVESGIITLAHLGRCWNSSSRMNSSMLPIGLFFFLGRFLFFGGLAQSVLSPFPVFCVYSGCPFLYRHRNIPELCHLSQEKVVRAVVIVPNPFQRDFRNQSGLKVGHLGNCNDLSELFFVLQGSKAIVGSVAHVVNLIHELTIDPVTMAAARNCQTISYKFNPSVFPAR